MVESRSKTASWVLWVVMALCTVVTVRTGDKVCSIGRHGWLSRFNGETVTVALPCMFRMADFTCADYRVQVIPGSSVDEDGGFTPDTVWLRVVDVARGGEGTFHTSLQRLAEYHSGDVRSVWKTTGGGLRGAEAAVSFNRTTRALTFSPVEQLSVVMLTEPPSVLLTCSADHFSSKASPETLCGDGTTSDTMEQAALRVLGDDSDLTTQQFVHYAIMNDVTVTQSATCRLAARQFQTCPRQQEAASTCHVILDDPSRVTCLRQSGTAPQHHYSQCLRAVCDGHASAYVAMETHLQKKCSGPIDGRKLPYRIVPNPLGSGGAISSMILLDGGRLLYVLNDLSQLRLVALSDPNTTLSTLQLSGPLQQAAQLTSGKVLVSVYDHSHLWLVTVAGDELQLEGQVRTDRPYFGLCPGPDDTVWASFFLEGRRSLVQQLDVQGRVLKTLLNDTAGRFHQIVRLRQYGHHLHLIDFNRPLGVLSLDTGEVTTKDLGITGAFDLVLDRKGDAYACAMGAMCVEAEICLVHIAPTGQVTPLDSLYSGTALQLLLCSQLILTHGQLMVSLVGMDNDLGYYSEITVQRLK